MNTLRVLVADDNRATAFGLARILESRGHTVATALNGVAALDTLNLFNPDVVILDLMMPVLDGYTVTRRIRSRPGYEHTPIVIVSALGQPQDKQRSLESGATYHLVKPIELDTLWSILEDLPKVEVH